MKKQTKREDGAYAYKFMQEVFVYLFHIPYLQSCQKRAASLVYQNLKNKTCRNRQMSVHCKKQMYLFLESFNLIIDHLVLYLIIKFDGVRQIILEMVNKMLTAKFSSTIINGFPTTTINGKDKM